MGSASGAHSSGCKSSRRASGFVVDLSHPDTAVESTIFPEYPGNLDGQSQDDAYDRFVQGPRERRGHSDGTSIRGRST